MDIFVDTSALYALMDADDANHVRARTAWEQWLDQPIVFVTSNYVLLESIALIQHRLGIQAVRETQEELIPVLRVHWTDAELHMTAYRIVLAANQRDFSLVDATSVEWMRRLSIHSIFAFDHHFPDRGFEQRP
jgi:predicted nucleic acid-binding protein